jgi:hypothetical protein
VLTVPYGVAGVDEVQRTYDENALDALFEGWTVVDRTIAVRDESGMWTIGDGGAAERAVAMLVARPPKRD